jgi:alpha-tubulin suppressor-like RCC1 family protein
MNKTTLIEELHNKVNESISLEEIQIISKCVELLKIGSVKTVTTYTDLLNEYPQKGEVYFVEDEERLYFGMGQYWYKVTETANLQAWSWGYNGSGALGDGTTIAKSSPVSVVGGFTDWIQLNSCGSHSLGIRANGTAWSWGAGSFVLGAIGDGTTINRSSPVLVIGGFTDWVQVAAGYRHSLGLRANGTAWAWGFNDTGRLGDGTTIAKSSPVSVVGGFTDWVQVAVGNMQNLGIRANGTAWAWGSNFNGLLGDGTTINKSSPVSVIGGFTDWSQVSGGVDHSLGIRANGTAWAWGSNGNGRLGDDTTINKSSPVSVIGGFTDWVQVSGGGAHSLGIRANGSAWAWGSNSFGSLGDGTLTNKSSPVSVVGGFTDWVQLDSKGFSSFTINSFSLGLRANGTAWAWGSNLDGRLGDGTTIGTSSPVSVIGGFTDWVQVAAGRFHGLGIRSL